jgi:hypothetical protein
VRKDNNSRTRRFTGRQFRCAPLPPVSFVVEGVEKPQIGTNLRKNSAEEKSKMGMEIPMKARQSLHSKDLKTLPKEVSTSAVLSSCIAPDSLACEEGLFLRPR